MRRAAGIAVLGLSGLMAGPVQADMALNMVRYGCARGVEIPVAYVNSGQDSAAVLQVEGRQIGLVQTQAASGLRFAWPSDGAGYVWRTKGEEGVLLWRDASGSEDILVAACKAKG